MSLDKNPNTIIIEFNKELKLISQSFQSESTNYQKKLIKNPLVKNLGFEFLKNYGIKKSISSSIVNSLDIEFEKFNEYQLLYNRFHDLLNRIEAFLKQISINTKLIRSPGNSNRLLTKLNPVYNSVKLETKLRRLTNALKSIESLNLIYNIDLKEKLERKLEKIDKIDNSQLKNLFQKQENLDLEFKLTAPNKIEFAKLISSMANTEGGKIIIGISDNKDIVGVNSIDESLNILENALNSIFPKIEVITKNIKENNKEVLIIEIPKSDKKPHMVNDTIYHRENDRIVKTSSIDLVQLISKSDSQNEVRNLASVIETLTLKINDMNSWRGKLKDWIIGGIIGSLIGFSITLILSVLI